MMHRSATWEEFTRKQRSGWRGVGLLTCAGLVIVLIATRASALWYVAPNVYLWGQIMLGGPVPGAHGGNTSP